MKQCLWGGNWVENGGIYAACVQANMMAKYGGQIWWANEIRRVSYRLQHLALP